MDVEYAIQQIVEVGGEAHRDRHVRYGVFEDQIPADDPREDLAEDRVGVGVRAAGDRNHRRQFRVAQRRETAHERGDEERERDPRPRALPPDRGNGIAAVQQQIENRRIEDRLELEGLAGRRRAGQNENAGADYGSDTERRQAPRTQRLAQLPLRMLRGGDQRVDAAGP